MPIPRTTLFKSTKCPRCGEDDLIITLGKQTKRLYLTCREREVSWHHPDDVGDLQEMFIDLTRQQVRAVDNVILSIVV